MMARSRARLGVLLALLAPALCGCSSSSRVMSFAPPQEPVSAKDYDKVRDRWTRSGKIFQPKTLDTTLRVHATLYGPEFVSAYIAKSAKVFRLSLQEEAQLKRRLDEETTRGFVVFVGASTSDVRWNDFERKPGSVWQLGLVNDQQEQVNPEDVKPEREVTPTITELFPYVEDFYRAYTIRFPKQPPGGRPLLRAETERLTLRFSGALGQTDLEWRFR